VESEIAGAPRSGADRADLGWTRPAGLGAVVGGLALVAWSAAPLWVLLSGLTLVFSFGLPLVLVRFPGAARALLVAAVVFVAVAGAWFPYQRATGNAVARDRTHDGGVLVTREAARMVLRGENPYVERFEDVLPTSWLEVQGSDDEIVANPVMDHQPYLPASFLVHVPFVAAADLLGITWDPRVLGWMALVVVTLALAIRAGPAWARAGAVLCVGSAFTLVYLAWGTNDSLAMCALVGALLLAERRPGWAGVALALAISCKFLLLVAVPPLAVAVVAAHGWAGLRRWWTAPAVMVSTCLVFLALAPGDFVDDVLLFNLGRTEPLMPTSGIGLPATHPDVFQGPVLALVTLAGLALAFGVVPWLAGRLRSLAWVGPLTSLALVGLLIPARTFQANYLVLVVGVLATGWWLAPTGAERRATADGSGNLEPWSNVPPPVPSPMHPARTSSKTPTAV
jgi:hypothetical protein